MVLKRSKVNHLKTKKMLLKIKITKDRKTGYYTGQLIKIPEVISEGKTLAELKTNLIDAFKLILEVKSELRMPTNKSLPNIYELAV